MIKQLLSLNQLVRNLPTEALLKAMPEDDLKTIYTLIQVFRILAVTVWVFSCTTLYFIAVLLNPQSSLIDWSRDHKYLTIGFFTAFLFSPAFAMFSMSSELDPIATALYKGAALEALSPRNVWMLSLFIPSLIVPLLFLIYSVSGGVN